MMYNNSRGDDTTAPVGMHYISGGRNYRLLSFLTPTSTLLTPCCARFARLDGERANLNCLSRTFAVTAWGGGVL